MRTRGECAAHHATKGEIAEGRGLAPDVGLEPTTLRLTGGRSIVFLGRIRLHSPAAAMHLRIPKQCHRPFFAAVLSPIASRGLWGSALPRGVLRPSWVSACPGDSQMWRAAHRWPGIPRSSSPRSTQGVAARSSGRARRSHRRQAGPAVRRRHPWRSRTTGSRTGGLPRSRPACRAGCRNDAAPQRAPPRPPVQSMQRNLPAKMIRSSARMSRPSLRCSTTAMSRNSRETAQIGPSSGSLSAPTTLAKLLQGHSATCGVKPHFERAPSGNFAKGRSALSMA